MYFDISILRSVRAIFFQPLLLKLGLQAHFNTMCFSFATNLSPVKGVEENKSKIKNRISKKKQRENTQGHVFISQ